LGPSNFPITGCSLDGGGAVDISKPNGPPDCGVASAGQAPCTFMGGEVAIDEMLPNTKSLPCGSLKLDTGRQSCLRAERHPQRPHRVLPRYRQSGVGQRGLAVWLRLREDLQNPGAIAQFTEKGGGPEFIGDPGNAEAGVVLRRPTPSNPVSIPDAGLLVGAGYRVAGSLQSWSVATVQGETKSGLYTLHCTIHDWMHGSLSVS